MSEQSWRSGYCDVCRVTYVLTSDSRCPNCNTFIENPGPAPVIPAAPPSPAPAPEPASVPQFSASLTAAAGKAPVTPCCTGPGQTKSSVLRAAAENRTVLEQLEDALLKVGPCGGGLLGGLLGAGMFGNTAPPLFGFIVGGAAGGGATYAALYGFFLLVNPKRDRSQ